MSPSAAWPERWATAAQSRKQRPRAGHQAAFLPRTSWARWAPGGMSPYLTGPGGGPPAGAALITMASGAVDLLTLQPQCRPGPPAQRPPLSSPGPGPCRLCSAGHHQSVRQGLGLDTPTPSSPGSQPPGHPPPLSAPGGLPSPRTVPGKHSAGLPGAGLGTENSKDKATCAPRLTTPVKDSCPDSITTRGLQAQALHMTM